MYMYMYVYSCICVFAGEENDIQDYVNLKGDLSLILRSEYIFEVTMSCCFVPMKVSS